MLQRAGMAAALLNEPRIVFLDEPTQPRSARPAARARPDARTEEPRHDRVPQFHLLGEVEQTCDRVAFVKQGRVVREHVLGAGGALGALEVDVRADGLAPAALAALARHGEVRESGGALCVRVPGPDAVPELAREVVAHGGRLHHLAARRTSLEALFLEVMGDEGRPG